LNIVKHKGGKYREGDIVKPEKSNAIGYPETGSNRQIVKQLS
jgi:hypothetical protein